MRKVIIFTIAAIYLFSASMLNFLFSPPTSATNCMDVQFVFARGSGEELSGPSYIAWRDSITEQLGKTSLRYDFYELGTRTYGNYQYPAVTVGASLYGISNLVGAAVSGGVAFEFGRSVEQGIGELEAYLSHTSALCSRTKYVLGGYSQGAMIVSRALRDLDASKIIYAATFGDPKLYLPEGNSRTLELLPKIPDACYGKDLSNYRLHVPDCYTYEGILGSYRPYQTDAYIDKLGTWCNDSDIMCSSGLSLSDHLAYVSSDLYNDAARVIASKIKETFSNRTFTATSTTTTNLAEVAILIDSTRSMEKLIDQYKAEASRLAAQVVANHGHIALYEFRDLQERFAAQQHCDFTCTLDTFRTELADITTYGGADRPESALSAALTAMNQLKWSPGATKSIIILTDAPYLDPDRDGTTLAAVTRRSLEIDPVNIYVLTNRPDTAQSYQPLIAGTNGRAFDLDTELELSTEAILTRPVAKLTLSSYSGLVNQPLTFDASRSYTLDDAALHYDWDLDGDGIFEHPDAGPVITQTYTRPTNHYVQVKVYTSPDNASTMSAELSVTTADQVRVATISQLSASQDTAGQFTVNFETNAERVLLIIDDAVQDFVPFQQGKGSFVLENIIGTAKITLVPYLDNHRGIAQSTEIHSAVPKVPNTAGATSTSDPFLSQGWAKYLNVLSQ